jgi:hypothetical protein
MELCGDMLLVVSSGIYVYDSIKCEKIFSYHRPDNRRLSKCAHLYWDKVLITDSSGDVRLWRASTHQLLIDFQPHRYKDVLDAGLISSERMATFSNKQLALWDLSDIGKAIHYIPLRAVPAYPPRSTWVCLPFLAIACVT